MWVSGKLSKEKVLRDLYTEVCQAVPHSVCSQGVRNVLERFDVATRQSLVSQISSSTGCSPFFIACKKGALEMVRYFHENCKAELDQRGVFIKEDDRTSHIVTPLGCAAIEGHHKVVQYLIENGADVNAVSDTGSTPVRSACFMNHVRIVKLLVESGADVNKANMTGSTCLINSIQSEELVLYLLEKGADINAQDVEKKTALIYAIKEHRFETVKLLLLKGANPYLRSYPHGDDALRMACLGGDTAIFYHLVNFVEYKPEQVASAFELMGSTMFMEENNVQEMSIFWKAAIDVRNEHGMGKTILEGKEAFGFVTEFIEMEDFETMDIDELWIQSLIISDRCLGSDHPELCWRLLSYGNMCRNAGTHVMHQKCIRLWTYTLTLYVQQYTILYDDPSNIAYLLTKLLFDIRNEEDSLDLDQIISLVEFLVTDMCKSYKLLKIAPEYEKQQVAFSRVCKSLTFLIYLTTLTKANKEQTSRLYRSVHAAISTFDVRTALGESLLHLSVKSGNVLSSEDGFSPFPSYEVVKILIDCGADVNATNKYHDTALHIASRPENFSNKIVELLLENGCHIDSPNKGGETPLKLLKDVPGSQINAVNYLSLQCLCVDVILKNEFSFKEHECPNTVMAFIDQHRCE